VKLPSLTGSLGEAFRIYGKGTVLIVENYVGDMPSVATLKVGEVSAKVTGVEFPRKTVWRADGSIELDKSMIGLVVEGDIKEQLLDLKGQPVEVFEI